MKHSTQPFRLASLFSFSLLFLLSAYTGSASADTDDATETTDEAEVMPVIISTLLSGTPTTLFRDADADTFGDAAVSVLAEPPLSGYVENSFDCDDSDDSINPDAPEILDDRDNDCDGQIDEGLGTPYYRDADSDGYGDPNISQIATSPPAGYVENSFDCDDSDANINPDALEIPGDNKDNNCDGVIDEP